LIKKAPFSRLAKTEKAESRWWRDEHFSGKRNEENGVFLQRLFNILMPEQSLIQYIFQKLQHNLKLFPYLSTTNLK
jgi:hypothetical protein